MILQSPNCPRTYLFEVSIAVAISACPLRHEPVSDRKNKKNLKLATDIFGTAVPNYG